MKNYKKVIALLMAASMTVGLAACGGKEGDGSQGDGKKPDSQNPGNSGNGDDDSQKDDYDPYTPLIDPDTGEVYDLGGMEIIIRDWWTQEQEVDESALSGFQKAQYEYRKWMQDTYKFTIKEQAISGWGDVFTDIEAYATTGGDENNYVFTLRVAGELFQQMGMGLYYDLSSLNSIDMTAEKWDQTVKDLGTLNGKVYAMRKMSHEPRTGVYFNKRILRENGFEPDDIYKWQASREWTWDKFEEIVAALTKDTNADGVPDQYGFLEGNSLNDIAIASNDGNLISKDGSGKYVFTADSENVITALNWARHMMDEYNYPNPNDDPGATWNYFFDAFINGNAAFLVQQAYCSGQEFSRDNMEDDFGWVAFPMGPNATQYADLMQDNVYVLPACYDADRAKKIAFAYSMYYSPVPDYEDYSDYYANYVNSFRDMEVPEQTLGYVGEKTYLQYHSFVPGIKVGDDLYWQISAENTPAQQIESIRESWQAYIDAANGVGTDEGDEGGE